MKSSAGMYEGSGSQFFRITAGMQLGPQTFDESRLVIIFLTSFLITVIDAEDNTSGLLNRGVVTDLPF